jgi:hypothetical protein
MLAPSGTWFDYNSFQKLGALIARLNLDILVILRVDVNRSQPAMILRDVRGLEAKRVFFHHDTIIRPTFAIA